MQKQSLYEVAFFIFRNRINMSQITAKRILESIPFRFRPEKAQNYSANFQFDITGEEAAAYTVVINNGSCSIHPGLVGPPTCTVKTKASVYVELETGKLNPQMALMIGKVKVSNLAAMMQFARCFRKFDATVNYENSLRSDANNEIDESLVRPTKVGPLAGVKIIDFTRLLPGPLATMFLADMGADVIKVEDPDNPDYIRDFEPMVNGTSMFYLSLNRSKRSLAVNYLSGEGRQIIYDLVKDADVLVEQFRPGVMNEIGFGYNELCRINPRLIYVSISGYGQHSSMAQAAGHDLNYISIAGALGITGDKENITIPGFQLADIAGGSYMAMTAITTALFNRERNQKGEWIDLAMTDAVLPFSVLPFAYHQATKINPDRGGFELSGALVNYNVYRCSDNKYVALGSLEPKFWNKFCAKVNRPDWAERFLQKGNDLKELKGEVESMFLSKTREEWILLMKGEDVCLTAVNDLNELANDSYLNERDMFVVNEHSSVGKFKTIQQPIKFKYANIGEQWNAPELGEDSTGVLRELNYTDERIAELRSSNVVKLKS